MSTSPHDDESSPNSAQEPSDAAEGQRPQPRYGAYASPAEAAAQPGDDASPDQSTKPLAAGAYNPYAQPSWGQPGPSQPPGNPYGAGPEESDPSGAGQSGYHNPYGSPQQPQYAQPTQQQPPQQGFALPPRPKRPATLWTVLVTLLSAGVASLVWGIYVFNAIQAQGVEGIFGASFGDAMTEEMERQYAQDPTLQEFSPEELDELMLATLGMFALIWAAVLLALYITTAFLGAMAGNPGRILATIWAALSLLFFTLGHDGISYGIISVTVALSIVAIVMMWLSPSTQYIRHRKWEKETIRNGFQQGPPSGYWQP